MPVTARLVSAVEDATATVIRATVEFVDGDKTVVREYRISEPEALRKIARDQIAEMERQKAVAAYVAAPPVGEIKLVDDPVQPSIAEAKANAYQLAQARLSRLRDALTLGLITQTQYDTRLAAIKKALSDAGVDVVTVLSA